MALLDLAPVERLGFSAARAFFRGFGQAKPFAEALPDLAASIRKGRGPNKAPTKKLVSLRLSGQVLEAYKAKGPGWPSRIDDDLRRINEIK